MRSFLPSTVTFAHTLLPSCDQNTLEQNPSFAPSSFFNSDLLAFLERQIPTACFPTAGDGEPFGSQFFQPAGPASNHCSNRTGQAFRRFWASRIAAVKSTPLFAAHRPISAPSSRPAKIFSQSTVAGCALQPGIGVGDAGTAAFAELGHRDGTFLPNPIQFWFGGGRNFGWRPTSVRPMLAAVPATKLAAAKMDAIAKGSEATAAATEMKERTV